MDIVNVIKQVIKLFTGKSVPTTNDIINNLTKSNRNPQPKSQSYSSPTPAPKPEKEPEENFNHYNMDSARKYFREILQTEFSQYELRENVPVTSVRGSETLVEEKFWKDMPRKHYKPEEGRAYDFGMYQLGDLKAVVSLGQGSSHDKKKEYLVSRAYARKAGIPYINFYIQFDNDKPYVVNRIKSMMA